MATRTDLPVTLSHADALAVASLLSDAANRLGAHAASTKSEVVRTVCRREAAQARALATSITDAAYGWE